jgi:uncharacterized protein involved in exopolysaccharide biosynthesis
LQVAEQSAELLVIEEATVPELSLGPDLGTNALFGGVTGLTLAILISAVFAFVRIPTRT